MPYFTDRIGNCLRCGALYGWLYGDGMVFPELSRFGRVGVLQDFEGGIMTEPPGPDGFAYLRLGLAQQACPACPPYILFIVTLCAKAQ